MPRNSYIDSPVNRYAIGVVIGAAAQVARIPLHSQAALPFITYAPFVVVSALIGGLGPGLVTTLLCTLELTCFTIKPSGMTALEDAPNWFGIAIFLTMGVAASLLAERLWNSRERLVSVLESISDGFITLDRRWRYTYVNGAAAKTRGKTAQELLGKNIWELWPQAADTIIGAAYRRAMEENRPVQVEAFCPEPFNAWFEIRCYPSREGLSVFFTNTQDRRQAQQTSRLLSSIVESSDDAIISKDLNGVILSWNNGAERIYGYTASEAVGRVVSFLIPPEQHNEYPRLMEELKAGKSVDHYETERIAKDGRRIIVSLTLSPLREDGRLVGASVIARDITGKKQAEQELERRVAERTAQWQASNRELEAFAYSVSHDLRAPLRAIDGFSRILLEEHSGSVSREGQRYLSIIRKNALQMGELIDDLLSFSRLKRQAVNKQLVDMTALVRCILDDFVNEQRGRQIETEIHELPPCEADAALVRQAWMNLLSNAVKYTRYRTPARIEVGAICSEGPAVYFVRDNGAGFDMRYGDKLFGVFQRLHRAEDYEGTGVGLALVERIVSRHGGQVWAEAAVDQGATFYFTLEAASGEKPQPARVSAARAPQCLE